MNDLINSSAQPNFLIVILATAAVYLFLVVAIIVFGKREIGQLSITELVFLLLISNSVQNAMVDSSWDSLWVGIAAALTLFALNFLFKQLKYQIPLFQKIIEGTPVLLIYRGQIMTENIRREKIMVTELEGVIRENGFQNIGDVSLAMLETNGNISVVGFKDERSFAFRGKKRNKPPKMKQ